MDKVLVFIDSLALLQLRDVDNICRELDDTRSCLNGYCRLKEECEPLLTVANFRELVDPGEYGYSGCSVCVEVVARILLDGLSQLETLSVPAVQVGFDGDILTVSPSSLLNWVSDAL